jgi:hypothetical protein
MRERTRQCRLEEAFRQELFRLLNQYLRSPEDATLGKFVRTLVTFQQVRAAVEELCQRTCVAVLPGHQPDNTNVFPPKHDRMHRPFGIDEAARAE